MKRRGVCGEQASAQVRARSPRAWERCVTVSCVPIFLSLLLSVAHLTDQNVRPSHPHYHPQDNHLDHPDHRCNDCCHQDHHGSRREQQGWGLGGLVGMGMRRGAGAGGAREWGAGGMLREGWGRGAVLFRCLSTPYTQRGTVGVVVSTETTITTHTTTAREGTIRDSEVFFSRTADPLKSSPWGFAMLGCSLVTISLVVLNFCACRTFISSRVVAAPVVVVN